MLIYQLFLFRVDRSCMVGEYQKEYAGF